MAKKPTDPQHQPKHAGAGKEQTNNDNARRKENENNVESADTAKPDGEYATKADVDKTPPTTGTERADLGNVNKEGEKTTPKSGYREMTAETGNKLSTREKLKEYFGMLSLDSHEVFARGNKDLFIHGEGFRKKGLKMKAFQKGTMIAGDTMTELGKAITGGYQAGQSMVKG